MKMFVRVLLLSFLLFINAISNSQTNFKSSNLPIVVIKTNGDIVDDPKVAATMGIINNGVGKTNLITDSYNDYNGYIGIELRGNSTQSFPKKPYNFETRTNSGEDLEAPILGMPADKDWSLIASYLDHTFLRNPLALYMSQNTGRWACRFRLVELVINEEYQGIYILMESIKRSKNRLNLAKLDSSCVSGASVTGGYIWEITGFESNIGEARNLKYPKFDKVMPEQIAYITNYDDSFRTVMNSNSYKDDVNGYNKWIDVNSFIDEMLVQEAMRNSDAYGWSGYFHKNINGKIMAGPVWDFDQSAGNSSYPDDGVVEGWLFSSTETMNTPFFWNKLFEDQSFGYRMRLRWESLRLGAFSDKNLTAFIDSIAGYLSEAQVREFDKWPVLGKYIWRETSGFEDRTTYESEVEYLKDFLLERWQWMDEELAKIQNPNPTAISANNQNNLVVYPNPVKDHIIFNINSIGSYKAVIQIVTISGSFIQNSGTLKLSEGLNRFTFNFGSNIPEGLYFYKVLINNSLEFSGRFVKVK